MLRFVSATVLAVAVLSSAPAFANEFCDKELKPLIAQRMSLGQSLQAIGKRGQEPGAREKFCGTLNAYIANIRKTIAYMETNKDFCGIPDSAIEQAKKGLAQNMTLRKKVCLGPPPEARQQQQERGPAPTIKPPSSLNLQ